MVKLFSVPILAGILLGIAFPYKSLSLIWLSSFLLFALLFVNTLVVDAQQILTSFKSHWRQILVTQGLIFLFFPVLLTAASSLAINDTDFVFGLSLSTLAPCALVNPFFARVRSGLPALALANVLVSTLLTPILTLPVVNFMQHGHVYINPWSLFYYLFFISFTPVFLSVAVKRFYPQVDKKFAQVLPAFNSCVLALLMFILVGSSLNRLPSRAQMSGDFLLLFLFYLAMDFGVFALVRSGANAFVPKAEAETMALSVATRNFALSASLLLFFHPKAALPSAVGLIVHCLFFQWLMLKNSDNAKA